MVSITFATAGDVQEGPYTATDILPRKILDKCIKILKSMKQRLDRDGPIKSK